MCQSTAHKLFGSQWCSTATVAPERLSIWNLWQEMINSPVQTCATFLGGLKAGRWWKVADRSTLAAHYLIVRCLYRSKVVPWWTRTHPVTNNLSSPWPWQLTRLQKWGKKVENRQWKGPGFKGVWAILTKPLASRRLRLKLLMLKTRKLFLGNHLKNWSAYQLWVCIAEWCRRLR